MVLCVENADKSEEICEYLKESIVELANDEDEKNLTLSLNKSLSRLYLMSDILHNCCVKVANVASYRRRIEIILPTVFESLNKMFNKIDGKMKSEWFKQKVLQCIKVWLHWNIYPDEFLNNLKGVFLELRNKVIMVPKTIGVISSYNSTSDSDSDDVDGIPLDE
jgi:U2-associated protein SR140